MSARSTCNKIKLSFKGIKDILRNKLQTMHINKDSLGKIIQGETSLLSYLKLYPKEIISSLCGWAGLIFTVSSFFADNKYLRGIFVGIVIFSFFYSSYKIWEKQKVKNLNKAIIKASLDTRWGNGITQTQSCNGSTLFYIQVKVEAGSTATVKNCKAFLKTVLNKKNDKEIDNESIPFVWSLTSEDSQNVEQNIPKRVNLFSSEQGNNVLFPHTKPVQNSVKNFFKNKGTYVVSLIFTADNAEQVFKSFTIEWDGNFQTSSVTESAG